MTPNFVFSEFRCKCGCEPSKAVQVRAERVAVQLEVLRAELNQPIRVISGHRCTTHNAKSGGAPLSRHLYGDAADIQVERWTGKQLRDLVEGLIALGKMRDGGIGTYHSRPATLHYDLRDAPKRWHH